jgi:hypothetical protein
MENDGRLVTSVTGDKTVFDVVGGFDTPEALDWPPREKSSMA